MSEDPRIRKRPRIQLLLLLGELLSTRDKRNIQPV